MKRELNIVNSERRHIVTVVMPILPGKAEAWRRFKQELEGSRQEDFTNWCHQMDLTIGKIWLSDTPGGAVAVLNLQLADQEAAVAKLADTTQPFEHWLRDQILSLHGLDLTKIARTSTDRTL